MPLFAAASNRESEIIPEIGEPTVMLRPMKTGGEVVEDYVHLGLSLRAHPVSFLRSDLRSRKIVTCAEAMRDADNKWVEAAGIVLVRQKPGSAKGVMFITIEDETGIANLVIWPSLYEKQRRIVHSAGMMAVYGRIQREGEVVHLVAHRLTDLSGELASICAMVRVPAPEEEDRRRISRERKALTTERVRHVNRIKGLLFGQGVSG
jgi:error-prone DNA polymerase